MRTKFSAAVALLALGLAGAAFAQAPGGPPPGAGPGGPPGGGAGGPRGGGGPPMTVESTAFPDGGVIPLENSMYGANTQPDFRITNVPASAQSIALIFHDLDVASAGNPDDNLHWMAWNIPVANGTATLEKGKLPDGAMSKSMRGNAYAGPGAPNTPRYHHYVFEFYALSSKLDLPADAGRPQLLDAMKGKVVGKHSYVGRFRNDTGATMPGRGGGAGGPPGGGPPRGPGAGGPPPGAAPGGY
jgi:Raf kinase inhibitor-like YbhB/YbcL family protein